MPWMSAVSSLFYTVYVISIVTMQKAHELGRLTRFGGLADGVRGYMVAAYIFLILRS
jgi:hypothetical protein